MSRRKLPSLNGLRAFEAAGRLGRMTLAAEELAVTHGAVSRKVRDLEVVLGVKLFAGPKNRLELTDAGRRLLASLTPAFDQIEAAVSIVADEEEGMLDVSCLSTFTMRWLIPRLFRFSAKFPGIEVRLTASDHPVDFRREQYEVAIRVDDHELPRHAYVTKLLDEQVGPVLAPALLGRSNVDRPEDLLRFPLLHTKTRPQAWASWMADISGKRGFEGRVFEHFYFMLEAAIAGLGVCIAPWPLVADDVVAGRLIAPFGFLPSGRSYVAVRTQRRSRKAERFCDWLTSEARNSPPPPAGPAGARSCGLPLATGDDGAGGLGR